MNENVNVLLVHCAWADGSCWAKVIPLLQSHGFNVTAAHDKPPLSGPGEMLVQQGQGRLM